MNFVPVEKLPERGVKQWNCGPRKDIHPMLAAFNKGPHKIVRVDYEEAYEYCGRDSCLYSLRASIKRGAFPIKVVIRQGDIYLVKTEKEKKAPPTAMRVEPLTFATRYGAEAFIDALQNIADTYGCASVQDAFDLMNLSAGSNAKKYGWTYVQLRDLTPARINDSYSVKMPIATYLG